MISSATVEQVRSASPIVAITQEYVQLKKTGAQWSGRCPLHGERTPSFVVSAEKGTYFCHGCKAGGDVFKLVEELEGLEFYDVVRRLADRAGILITEEGDNPDELVEKRRARDLKERMYRVCTLSAKFFESQLLEGSPTAQPWQIAARDLAIAELTARSVTEDSIALYRIGYAPCAPDALWQHLKANQVSPEDAQQAGVVLAAKNGNGFYDRFRHRVMFSICDRSGRVVSFSGRRLPVPEGIPTTEQWIAKGEETPKYLTGPESLLFRKKELLLGLQIAKISMRNPTKRTILCEGNYDMVSLHQHDHEPVLAWLGTNVTVEQSNLLASMSASKKVSIALDGDHAGRTATRTAIPMLLNAGLDVNVLQMPVHADPDQLMRSAVGDEVMSLRSFSAPSGLTWLIDDAALFGDQSDHDRTLKTIGRYLPRLSDRARRILVQRACTALKLSDSEVRSMMIQGVERAVHAT